MLKERKYCSGLPVAHRCLQICLPAPHAHQGRNRVRVIVAPAARGFRVPAYAVSPEPSARTGGYVRPDKAGPTM